MAFSTRTLVTLAFFFLASLVGVAQFPETCDASHLSYSPVEVNWRMFAPEHRFEADHYIVPPVVHYATLEDCLSYASDAVVLAVLLMQTEKSTGREPYIDNYVRTSLATAFSLLVAYEWGFGLSTESIIDNLRALAKEWLPSDPHKRIADTESSSFYEQFDAEYNKQAALEVEQRCREALDGDAETVFCALESALSAAVVAVTGSRSEADAFVETIKNYAPPCFLERVCPAGLLPIFAGQTNLTFSHHNGTFHDISTPMSYEEACANEQLFPLSQEQVERGLAYYFKRLRYSDLNDEALSFGDRVAHFATDPARLKKLTSAASNTAKFVVGYSLYCDASLNENFSAPPITAFPAGSKALSVTGLTLANRLAAAISAGTKFWNSHNEWIAAQANRDVISRRDTTSHALEIALSEVDELLRELKDGIATAAKEKRLRDSVALIDTYEEALRSYDLLKERKRLADQSATAARLSLEHAEAQLADAQRSYWMDAAGGLDALMRFLSAGTKLSLKLAVNSGWVVKEGATAVQALPDALEKLSPGLATIMITANLMLDLSTAYDMYGVQAAANQILQTSASLDPELRAALSVAQGQDWTTWWIYFTFDVLKDARNIVAAMVSWGAIEFIAHTHGWDPKVSMARSIIMIWSLTLLNAVIPSYWNWAEETTSEAKSLHRQSLLLAIKEALDGTGNSPEYERIHERVVRTLAAMGKVVDPSLMNSMIVSQLLHELIQCDSRYASYIMLDRYRNGDHDVALFLGQLGLNAEQLKSLRAAPSELWLKALGKEDSLREALVGIEGGSIDFLKAAIQQ